MNEQAIREAVVHRYPDTEVVEAMGDFFFFACGQLDPDRRMPFATLVTSDPYERVARLDRPGVFRLNVGVTPETYRALFGELPRGDGSAVVETGHDFAALDQLMPHPTYAPMGWIGVLNPGAETLQTLWPLLDEAHARAARRVRARANRRDSGA
ncbi:hypothetical protein Dcar01_02134 [Deinococcus carri]|uniref:DUF6194 domain-containing protein n=1 Tax=Deinococcus carri TaxID=1211323 RepID=A0ABP9W7S2_9DEIO